MTLSKQHKILILFLSTKNPWWKDIPQSQGRDVTQERIFGSADVTRESYFKWVRGQPMKPTTAHVIFDKTRSYINHGGFHERGRADAGLPPLRQDDEIKGHLRQAAELAKRALTAGHEHRMTLVHEGRELSWPVTRDEFESRTRPLLARLRTPIERAIRPDEPSARPSSQGFTRQVGAKLERRLTQPNPTGLGNN